MSILDLIPWWFWVIAVAVSILHAIPGWIYGLYSIATKFRDENDSDWKSTIQNHKVLWFRVYCLYHAFLYFISSFAGFISLYIALAILQIKLSVNFEISGSTGAVLIALFVLAIAGISGVLARILHEMKSLPGFGGS